MNLKPRTINTFYDNKATYYDEFYTNTNEERNDRYHIIPSKC